MLGVSSQRWGWSWIHAGTPSLPSSTHVHLCARRPTGEYAVRTAQADAGPELISHRACALAQQSELLTNPTESTPLGGRAWLFWELPRGSDAWEFWEPLLYPNCCFSHTVQGHWSHLHCSKLSARTDTRFSSSVNFKYIIQHVQSTYSVPALTGT